MNEWKMLLKILISALERNGYHQLIKNQYNKLVKIFKNIQGYGILYQNKG